MLVTNAAGCSGTSSITISVITCQTGTSEIGVLSGQVQVFPNPFSESATLEIKDFGIGIKNLQLYIYDVFGKEMRKSEIQSTKFKIARENLPGEIYFFKIYSEGKILGTGKLVITD